MVTQWGPERFSPHSLAQELHAPSPRLPTLVFLLQGGICCSSLMVLPHRTQDGCALVETQLSWATGQLSLASPSQESKNLIFHVYFFLFGWTNPSWTFANLISMYEYLPLSSETSVFKIHIRSAIRIDSITVSYRRLKYELRVSTI